MYNTKQSNTKQSNTKQANKTQVNKRQINKNGFSSNSFTFILYLDMQYKNEIERKKQCELFNRIYNNPYPKPDNNNEYDMELDFGLLF
jgi:hypothetical protein